MSWETSASALRAYLIHPDRTFCSEAAARLPNSQACGIYLAHLARLFPHRFKRIRRAASSRWRITGP
jgi:hypothetical protein